MFFCSALNVFVVDTFRYTAKLCVYLGKEQRVQLKGQTRYNKLENNTIKSLMLASVVIAQNVREDRVRRQYLLLNNASIVLYKRELS